MYARTLTSLFGSILTVSTVSAAFPEQAPGKAQGPGKTQSSVVVPFHEDEYPPNRGQSPNSPKVRVVAPAPEIIYQTYSGKDHCNIGHHLCSWLEHWKAKLHPKHCCPPQYGYQGIPSVAPHGASISPQGATTASPNMTLVPYTYNIPYSYTAMMPVAPQVSLHGAVLPTIAPQGATFGFGGLNITPAPTGTIGLQGAQIPQQSGISDAQLLQQLLMLLKVSQDVTPQGAAPCNKTVGAINPQGANGLSETSLAEIEKLKSQLIPQVAGLAQTANKHEDRLAIIEKNLADAKVSLTQQLLINQKQNEFNLKTDERLNKIEKSLPTGSKTGERKGTQNPD